jgi:hypothetical protein
MRNSEKKATPIRFHAGLQQLRKDAGGMDIGAREIWVDVVRRLRTLPVAARKLPIP